MNRYQKVIACLIRIVSVALPLQSLLGIGFASLMPRHMVKIALLGAVPSIVMGLLLFFMAIPLARLITWGIDDD